MPLTQLATSAGLDGSVVAAKVADLPAGHGLDAATGEYVEMFGAAIVEPAKVTLAAPYNAPSVAALFRTTDVVVADSAGRGSSPGRDGEPVRRVLGRRPA